MAALTGSCVVGDQAYEAGVAGLPDAQLRFARTWRDVYGVGLRALPWYSTLGNHDCAGNVSAAYAFAAEPSNSWRMEPGYTVEHASPDGSAALAVVVLDACTLVCAPARRGVGGKIGGSQTGGAEPQQQEEEEEAAAEEAEK